MATSRQKSAHKRNHHVDLTDQARDCCDNIATVAALLETYGAYPGAEIVGDNTVAHSGMMISREIDKLSGLVDALDRSFAGISLNKGRKRGRKNNKGT